MEIKILETYQYENRLGPSNTAASIKGNVKKLGLNYQSRVYIFNTFDHILRSVYANPDGSFEVKGLAKSIPYCIFSRDIQKQYNAVIQDNVVPK